MREIHKFGCKKKEECESIIFKQDPIWLFIKADLFKRKAKIYSFKKLIEFENGSKYSFLCVVSKNENKAHFASIFDSIVFNPIVLGKT